MKQHPPTPLKGGEEKTWEAVKLELKNDMATTAVNTRNFVDAYDTYFRDAILIKIDRDIVYLSSPESDILMEGITKFEHRLISTFERISRRVLKFTVIQQPDSIGGERR